MIGVVQESGRLQDGANQKPSYSLRTLCRALEYCRTALPLYGMQKALLDGLKMAFMTQLDPGCGHIIHSLINLHVTGSAKTPKVIPELAQKVIMLRFLFKLCWTTVRP